MKPQQIYYAKVAARLHAGGFWIFYTAANSFCLYFFMQTVLGLLPPTANIPACYAFSLVGFILTSFVNYTGIEAIYFCKKHGIDYWEGSLK
jgi:amino acid transporter